VDTHIVGLVQLVRFLVMELTHLDSNSRFDMSVVFMANYFLVEGDVPIDNKVLFSDQLCEF
jgi:hypothetical protein